MPGWMNHKLESRLKVKVDHSCPTLCDPMDYTVYGILQGRIMGWVTEPFPSPGDLPNLRIKPGYPAFQADALTSEPPGKPTPVCLPGKFYGQRSLAGYSPWGHKESDTTGRFSLSNHLKMLFKTHVFL